MSGWSVEGFARYWADPQPSDFGSGVTDDVVGYWPGNAPPARGRVEYAQRINSVLALLPGMRLEVAEHATNGQYTFIRWVLHATGRRGRSTLTGVDRVLLRDGRVAENRIIFDSAEFLDLSGHRLPWT